MIDDVDPKAELQRLIEARTCELCNAISDRPEDLVHEWRSIRLRQNGYIRKHSKYWQICVTCAIRAANCWPIFDPNASIWPSFDPIFGQEIQPMTQPSGRIFYLDFVYGISSNETSDRYEHSPA